jgi:hypothetical protein
MSGRLRRLESLLVFTVLVAALQAPGAAIAATTLRGTLATPVDQVGPRARIRGTLGEAVVGTARGGGVEVRSGHRRPLVDTNGPIWTLGAFPNPYLEEFVDLVLVADEPLAEGSVTVEVDGAAAIPVRLAGTAEAWFVDNALSGSVAETSLRACGTDRAGNVGCFVSELAALIVEAPIGATLVLPGGAGRLVIDPGAIDADAWVVAATHGPDAVQVLGPSRLPMRLERAAGRAAADIDDVTRLHWIGPDGALDSWFDDATGRIVARGSGPGLYRVAVGAPGTSRRVAAPPAPAFAAAPNPFTARTTVAFELSAPGPVRLDVLDVAGRLVARLVDSVPFSAGSHARTWDGATDAGAAAPAGIYFIRMTAPDQARTTKVVRLR